VKALVAAASVLASVAIAYAIGNGDIRATSPVTVVTVSSTTTGATGNMTLQNTTAATTYSVLVSADATCDPALSFSVGVGNPFAIAPNTSRAVQLSCPPRDTKAMRRCLFHATNNSNGTPLADFLGVCLYGSSTTLVPQQTSLDFGNVAVGQEGTLALDLRHMGTTAQHITRVYLQTGDVDGNFRFSTPCNPDAAFCEQGLASVVDTGGMLSVQVKCTPQATGTHTAQVYVGTNTFQLLSTGVTLTCNGTAATTPVLDAIPTTIDIQRPVEVLGDEASTVVHLSNPGSGTIVITDIRTVDVDTGTAPDWTYTASGACIGQITSMCVLDPGETIDLAVKFDPSVIGRRRATLLVSYRDTLNRTKEIPLDGIGAGATLRLVAALPSLNFGTVPVGRSAQLTFDLANYGNRDTMAAVTAAAPFSVTPGPNVVVSPGVKRTITATCAPTVVGMASTTISAAAADAFLSPTISVAATCEGTTQELFAQPSSLMLGELRAGAGPITRTIQVTTDNGIAVTLTGQPQLETPNPNITIGTLSSLTTPATFDVTFNLPSEATQGSFSTAITIGASNGDALRIPLAGKIVTASYVVAGTVDLGTFCINQPTTSSNTALVSDGTATIELTAPTLGQSPSPFELSLTSPSTYPSSLAAGASASIAITPHRQTTVTTVSDTLTWHTDVADMPIVSTQLTARFTDSGGAIAPPAVDFGKVTVHLFEDDGQRIVLQNCNDTPLALDPPMIRTPFSIDSPNFPAVLDPNETIAFSVGFHPTRKGVVTDTLRISSPQLPGPLEVTLIGEGQAPTEILPDAGTGNPDIGDTSFYACSCASSGSFVGGLPILIAFALLFRRRRRTHLE
jgi:uncharacterized protein (TIGR03382 family)